MMFKVTFKLDQAGLKNLIGGLPENADLHIETVELDSVRHVPADSAIHAPQSRALRGSKVNTAILKALAAGPRPVAALKSALVDAGFAAGSLSTSLAMLQKSGEVVRDGVGLYALSDKEAAE